jgi:alpha-galactosidase/6-phospho-beta-glucosidase family protein
MGRSTVGKPPGPEPGPRTPPRRADAPLRVAYIGGGSRFVPSVAHGIAWAMASAAEGPFPVCLALVDPDAGRAERMAAYVRLLAAHRGLPLEALVASREEALEGARLVLCSPGLPERWRLLEEVYARVGWRPPAEGPGAVAEAAAVGPFLLALAREAMARCPGAPLVTLLNPTDILAGAARRRFGAAGLRAVGLCVEVEGLRGALAFLLDAEEEDVVLVHGGVNHVGWVVRFSVAGRDGYGELGERLQALGDHPGLHPGNRLIPELYALTGLIRSSAYHAWPFTLPSPPSGTAGAFPDKRRLAEEAVDAALRSGQPVAEPTRVHPEASPLYYPGTGRAVGRMVRAMAAAEPAVLALQVPYAGEALGWAPEITVEVPTVVAGTEIAPVAVGPLPLGVDGLPRLLGQQRALASDYLAGPDAALLRRALAATPEWGSTAQIRALADAVHERFAAELEAAAAP